MLFVVTRSSPLLQPHSSAPWLPTTSGTARIQFHSMHRTTPPFRLGPAVMMWCRWRDWWPTITSGYEVGWRADRWCVKQQEMSSRIMGLFFGYQGAGTQGEQSLGSHDWCPPRDWALIGCWWSSECEWNMAFVSVTSESTMSSFAIVVKALPCFANLSQLHEDICGRNCGAMNFNEAHSIRNTMKEVFLMETEAWGC